MKKALLALALLGTAMSLSGCIVAPYGYGYGYGHARPGWCYYHPYRCR